MITNSRLGEFAFINVASLAAIEVGKYLDGWANIMWYAFLYLGLD